MSNGQDGFGGEGGGLTQPWTDATDAQARARDLIGRARDAVAGAAALGDGATLADKASVLSQEVGAHMQGAEERAQQWYHDAREALPGHDDAALQGVDEALGSKRFDDHDRLPWLESDDDEEYEGVDSKRVAVAVAAGLALTAAAVGGFWYFTHRPDNGVPVADGSVIAAPAESYKEAPKDPGGKQFAGTGDSSFAVSQGQERPAQLAGGDAAAAGANAAEAAASTAAAAGASFAGGAPVAGKPEAVAAAKPVAAPKPSAAADNGPSGGVVQIAAYTSESAAVAGWNRLVQGHEMLKGMNHRVVSAKIDLGTVYRLQLVTSAGGGAGLCERLKADGLPCQVKH
ncbi:hypothetical protein FHW96_003399 [Novosphingobium sp. SG751A]|uniref:SPOR domain-containing protein n=1 Tax=Novosphingobium sp. SG751A TaxID=2587000 RepID=UPI001557FB68|nr:SPOR domain-containing protein [Novosphingobium sp. SG751A]NOW47221.1 hypothetical protein [Novosphingobium sp. SG751A]